MEENLNQQKSSVPEPPKAEVTIRTMESDLQALEQGGGEITFPKPQIFTSREEPKIETDLNLPGYVGPEKAIFSPKPAASESPPLKKSLKWKPIIIIIGVLVIAAVLGVLGYLIASSWLFPKQMPIIK